MELLQENYRIPKDGQQPQPPTPNSNKSWSLKNTLTKWTNTFVDVNHSHLCLVGDEDSDFGSEIPFRSEVERYVAEKFGIPMLQFVFGGGQNTVATTLGFQGAPNAFSCIVKGSGRFCHAIEQCLELQSKLDKNTENREHVGWLLQTARLKPDSNPDKSISNHDFGQIESIISNQAKFLIFDHTTTDPSIIMKKLMIQQDPLTAPLELQLRNEPASIAKHQLFIRKGGRVLAVKLKDRAVRILCVPPHLPRFSAVGDEHFKGYDISLLYHLILSFNNGQTPPPKLVVTTCSNNGSERADRKYLVNTLISSPQMVSGSDCPVWLIDSESLEDDDAQSSIFDHQHPNYLVVKFFDADHFEKSLKNLPPTEFEKPNNRAVLGNIRDQLTLFRNNPYAAGEQHGYSYDEGITAGSFAGLRFHVGIVSSNNKHHKKSDKLRALLSYICNNVECSWIHTIFRGNFTNDLSDAVVYLCSGASLVVHKGGGGLADAIASQVERYHTVQRCATVLWLSLRAIMKEHGVNYNIIEELSTSSTRNAHVLTLFESSRKMVLKIAEKVDTWMKRSAVDIQAFEGQGYDYGLRMLTAFARVVRQCFQAHENTMSEDVRDQKKQAESLREWNRIALQRCRCEACLHLKQINKHHLASLPLWLCEEYASEKHQIDSLPHFVRDRQHSLAQLFSNDADKPGGSERANKTIELYQAPLFCFWPQCRDYEIEKN